MVSSEKWARILDKIGIDVPRGVSEFHTLCPLHDDLQDSLSINLDKGVFICHAGCAQGNLRHFVSLVSDISSVHLEKFLYDSMEDLQMYLPNEEDRDFKIEQKEISLPNSFQTNRVPEWIFDRGFTKETLRKWECGISLQTGSLIIPVRHVDDRLIGWIARQPPGAHPRYLYPSSMSTAQTVFGVNKMDGNPLLCITEGPLDTMWLDQIDFQSVCLFGAKMSNRQTEIIRDLKVKEIVLCLDNDATGQAAKKKIYDKLNKYFVVSSIILPEDYKDVQDVREYNVLTEIIESRSVFEI